MMKYMPKIFGTRRGVSYSAKIKPKKRKSKLDGYNRTKKLSEEYCPHCDSYYEVDPDKCDPCPGDCGHRLYPCNECPASMSDVRCDWEESKGCHRFVEEGAGE